MARPLLWPLVLSSLASRYPCYCFQRKILRSSTISLSMSSVSSKIQETLDPCVVLMKKMIAEYEVAWADKGVSYWEPPDSVKSAIEQAIATNTLHMYGPDEGLPELREALTVKLREENNLSNHHVMVTSGANQAYMNCVLSLLEDGDQAVFFRPYYFNHIMATQLAIGNAGVLLGECDEKGVPKLEWLEEQLESNPSIKIVTLTNPGNPTGVNLERDVVEHVVELCRMHNKWLILDCTYEHFQFNSKDTSVFLGFSENHVIHIFSFSKGYALAGYRCGYTVVSKEADGLYQQMRKAQDTIPICPSRFSQHAALGALSAGRKWVIDKVETLAASREAILKALSPLDQIMGGSGAMYLMAKLPTQNDDDEKVARLLVKDYGVAIIPGSYCGFPGWIRVCYSNLPPDQCVKAAERLACGIRDISRH